MNSINSIIVEGNVVRTPEIHETQKGSAYCKFAIAVNRWYKSNHGEVQQEVSFFDIETWNDLAKMCAESCEKGRGIRIVGRLRQNRWQDTDGKNQSRVLIIAEHVELKPKFNASPAGEAERGEKDALSDIAEAAFHAHEEQKAAVAF
ncbi:MAG: hypothetical protein Ta2A_25840 [Treponemataceae bacterium]|nr:MAG: hypothetical protein Ta2A_25840 [Treponemataceae bacterium]